MKKVTIKVPNNDKNLLNNSSILQDNKKNLLNNNSSTLQGNKKVPIHQIANYSLLSPKNTHILKTPNSIKVTFLTKNIKPINSNNNTFQKRKK